MKDTPEITALKRVRRSLERHVNKYIRLGSGPHRGPHDCDVAHAFWTARNIIDDQIRRLRKEQEQEQEQEKGDG